MDDERGHSTYYYAAGERVPLVRDPGLFAVKFRPGIRPDSPTIALQPRRLLREESTNVDFIPNYGLQIYEVDLRSRGINNNAEVSDDVLASVRSLNQEDAVEFATPAFRDTPDSPDAMFVSKRFIAQFKPEVTEEQIKEINNRNSVRIVEPLDFAENAYLLEAPDAEGNRSAIALANVYYESGLTLFAHPDFIKRRHWRGAHRIAREDNRSAVTTAARVSERTAYLGEQWHLEAAKVTDAWTITRGSPNITIAILDDGIDLSHPEFGGKVVEQFDFETNVEDGNPKRPLENHGTACAGVATAAGIKAYGVAPGCNLMAVRTPSFLAEVDEARMFKWTADGDADVISCSWGPVDGAGVAQPLPDILRAAINYCATEGRSGRGIPIFWAAGNGNESVSLDGYAANQDVMAIAASTSNETKAWYSDYGPEILVCAPSSGTLERGDEAIFTVDRRGAAGYNPGTAGLGDAAGDYTNDFGGTSAAAPLVAGIAGLMLSANPSLRREEVRDIFKRTAEKIGSNYGPDGHSSYFGYGQVNALEAVRVAQERVDGAQATGPTIEPFLEEPVTIFRSGGPPKFRVDPTPNSYYAVEVAIHPQLFDRAKHGGERNPRNFYASWVDSAFFSSLVYALPITVWDRLKHARRLYYRIWTSASDLEWLNWDVTISDSQVMEAPFLQIIRADERSVERTVRLPIGSEPMVPTELARLVLDESDNEISIRLMGDSIRIDNVEMEEPSASETRGPRALRSETSGQEAPSIMGPDTLDRSVDALAFTLVPGANPFCAVEVATDWRLFDRRNYGRLRNTSTFYGSWQDGLTEAITTYILPNQIWQRFRQAERLYYRVVTSSENSSAWPNYQTSTPDESAREAPSITLTGRVTSRRVNALYRADENLWR